MHSFHISMGFNISTNVLQDDMHPVVTSADRGNSHLDLKIREISLKLSFHGCSAQALLKFVIST